MPRGLTWWRKHDEQEFALGHQTFGYAELGFEVQRAALQDPDCPLRSEESAAALRNAKVNHAKCLMAIARRGHWRQSAKFAKSSGLGVLDFGRAIASRLRDEM